MTADLLLELARAWSRPDPVAEPELAAEFERLFVGPGPVPCPPYESYWRTEGPPVTWRTLMGPCVPELVALYARLGLQVRPEAAELPDHLAVELEALAVASQGEGPQGATGTAEVAGELLADHLARWLPAFCTAVHNATTLAHYRELAAATEQWLSDASAS